MGEIKIDLDIKNIKTKNEAVREILTEFIRMGLVTSNGLVVSNMGYLGDTTLSIKKTLNWLDAKMDALIGEEKLAEVKKKIFK